MSEIVQKFQKRLARYAVFARVFSSVEHTPRYVVHWYVLIIFGLVTVLASVALAWFVFAGVSAVVDDEFAQTTDVATIQRSELQKALDTYSARTVEFRQLQQSAPDIIDPGR